MKVKRDVLYNAAYSRLYQIMDSSDGLGVLKPDISTIDEAQFCLNILRQIASGKKRFVIDVEWPK